MDKLQKNQKQSILQRKHTTALSIPKDITIDRCLTSPAMSSTQVLADKVQYIHTIKYEIERFISMWSIDIDEYVVMMLAQEAQTFWENESVLDVCQAIRNGTSGKHGTTYNTITPATINEWMKLHLEDKYKAKETELLKFKQDKEPMQDVDYEAYKKRMDNDQDKIDKTIKLIRDR